MSSVIPFQRPKIKTVFDSMVDQIKTSTLPLSVKNALINIKESAHSDGIPETFWGTNRYAIDETHRVTKSFTITTCAREVFYREFVLQANTLHFELRTFASMQRPDMYADLAGIDLFQQLKYYAQASGLDEKDQALNVWAAILDQFTVDPLWQIVKCGFQSERWRIELSQNIDSEIWLSTTLFFDTLPLLLDQCARNAFISHRGT